MEEDITKKPLVDIFKEMSFLEHEIGLKEIKHKKEIELMQLKYERLRLEVVRRFPFIENDEEFKKKVKKI